MVYIYKNSKSYLIRFNQDFDDKITKEYLDVIRNSSDYCFEKMEDGWYDLSRNNPLFHGRLQTFYTVRTYYKRGRGILLPNLSATPCIFDNDGIAKALRDCGLSEIVLRLSENTQEV